jgi:hypothetical protein
MLPIVVVTVGEAALLIWSAFGGVSLEQALTFIPLSVAILLPWTVGMFLRGRGFARMTSEGLRIEAMTGVTVFKWDHIADVTIVSASSGEAVSPTNEPSTQTIILRLSRAWRVGLRSGTDVVGIPTHIKTVRFRVHDSDTFLRAAHSFMRR